MPTKGKSKKGVSSAELMRDHIEWETPLGKLKFGKLTIGDFQDFANEVQKRYETRVREGLKAAGIPIDIIAREIVKITTARPDETMLVADERSPFGVLFYLHRSLSKNHPDITMEQIRDNLGMEEIIALNAVIREFSVKGGVPSGAKKSESKPEDKS